MSNRGKTTSHDRFHYFGHCDLFDENIMKLNSKLMKNYISYTDHKINSLLYLDMEVQPHPNL
jgi:hypothetical protein